MARNRNVNTEELEDLNNDAETEEEVAETPKKKKDAPLNFESSPWQLLVKSVETPGVKVIKFEPGGKAERQLRFVASEPKIPFFYPVKDKEIPGLDAEWCIVNGLRFLVTKGMYLSLPKSIAEHLMECLNQTAMAPSGVQVMTETGLKPARLDLRSSSDQDALS